MNKAFLSLSLLSALSLGACSGGGGGGSSVPGVVYPMSGVYEGTINNGKGDFGVMGLAITTNGSKASGDYAIHFNDAPESIVNFALANTNVDGNNLSISGRLTNPALASENCPIQLNATMISANEIKGSYTGGDGQLDCAFATSTTVSFDLTRTQLQDAQKQVKSLHEAGSN